MDGESPAENLNGRDRDVGLVPVRPADDAPEPESPDGGGEDEQRGRHRPARVQASAGDAPAGRRLPATAPL